MIKAYKDSKAVERRIRKRMRHWAGERLWKEDLARVKERLAQREALARVEYNRMLDQELARLNAELAQREVSGIPHEVLTEGSER